MNYTFKFFISFFLFQIVYGQVIVDTSRGSAIGYHFDQGSNKSALYYGQADIFLGVPFAQPPVGSLRFSVNIFFFGSLFHSRDNPIFIFFKRVIDLL